MVLTLAQKLIFRAFFQTNGATTFVFPDPDTASTINVTFSNALPEYVPYAGEDWQVKFELLVMP